MTGDQPQHNHDRYFLFNNRCWLSALSLQDAGREAFNVIEIIDGKSLIYAEVARKWEESVLLGMPAR